MSYQIVKAGLVAILTAQQLAESKEVSDFKNAGSEEHSHTFILNRLSGQEDPLNEEQQAFLYDDQKWIIQIAYGKSVENSINQQDSLQTLIDLLIQKLDNPANWKSFCAILRYKTWKIEEVKSYFVATIQIKILDTLTYT